MGEHVAELKPCPFCGGDCRSFGRDDCGVGGVTIVRGQPGQQVQALIHIH